MVMSTAIDMYAPRAANEISCYNDIEEGMYKPSYRSGLQLSYRVPPSIESSIGGDDIKGDIRSGRKSYTVNEPTPLHNIYLQRELAKLYDECDTLASTHEFYRKSLEALMAEPAYQDNEALQHGLYTVGEWLRQRERHSLDHLSEIRAWLKQQADDVAGNTH